MTAPRDRGPGRRAAVEVVTGAARYAGDHVAPGMLHAKVLRSPHAHARVRSIETSAALSLPGVVAVATPADVPPYATDRPFLTDHPRFVGDAVAAVAALDVESAERALELLRVDWTLLPAVLDVREARSGPPAVHATRAVPGRHGVESPTMEFVLGDVDAELEAAPAVVRGVYRTPFQCHAHLEPQTCLAHWDDDGMVTLWATAQHVLASRVSLARVFGLPVERIRWHCQYLGGSYGGKDNSDEGKPHEEAIAVLLARMTGRPVRLRLTHRENLYCISGRHAFETQVTLAADSSGLLRAIDIDVVQDTGAYADDGASVLETAAAVVATSYRGCAVRLRGEAIYTNHPVGGEMWGFGAPQVTFAVEAALDLLAGRLGIDPVELRRINVRKSGDPLPGAGSALSYRQARSIDCLDAAVAAPRAVGDAAPGSKGRRAGTGLRVSAENSGKDDSNAVVVVTAEGEVVVPLGLGNMGTRAPEAIGILVAEVLGIAPSAVDVRWGDSTGAPWDPSGEGSRALHCTGDAAANAAWDAREQLLRAASVRTGLPMSGLTLRDGWVVADGSPVLTMGDAASRAPARGRVGPWFGGARGGRTAQDNRAYGRRIRVEESTWRLVDSVPRAVVGVGFSTRNPLRMPFAAQRADVAVDLATGAIDLGQLVTVADAGRVVSPRGAEAQLLGGACLSFGFALQEEFLLDPRTGEPLTVEMREIGVVSFASAPTVLGRLLPASRGVPPLGIGESGVQGAAAIASAVTSAVGGDGRQVVRLPIRPDDVLTLVHGTTSGEQSK